MHKQIGVLKPISQQRRNDLLSFGFDKQIKVAEIETNSVRFLLQRVANTIQSLCKR